MNFYEETIVEINNLIKENKFVEAIKIIDNELSMPYVPKEFEIQIRQIKNEIFLLTLNEEVNDSFSAEKIFELISLNSIDNFEKIGLVKKLETVNLRNYLDTIQKILLNEGIDQEIKTTILYLLKDQEINYDFKLLNEEIIMFNPSSFNYEEAEMVPIKIIKTIDDQIGHLNVQILEMSKQVVATMYYKLFPLVKNIDISAMSKAVIQKIYEINGLEISNDSSKLVTEYKNLLRKRGIV